VHLEHGSHRTLGAFTKGDAVNRRQVSALLVLTELGVKHQLESFSDRLTIQKSVYLAQAAGVDVGHYFNWYLRGPYAPTLTQDVFDAVQNYDTSTVAQEWQLDQGSHAKLSKLRTAFAAAPASLTQPLWLELLASVHFLLDRRQVESADPSVLQAQLLKYKKPFTVDQVTSALQKLRAVGLLPAATA